MKNWIINNDINKDNKYTYDNSEVKKTVNKLVNDESMKPILKV
ncbi:hypothetical protein SLITO_v1c06450 [Spiroplasma litorale]|uniref:Uncharacterized protein n=1 Tax=Spiroplasma litorale TaxID=216942 RepID=A0A0K1W1T9_9MOLU|nr:hypothetical protein [Spiroplasma litorale]AKX34274.1 hypothetical protein SLITO_v1c06450 [Spiroplasma litorale]